MIPIDLVEILRKDLNANKRPPDGLLHASSDLVGSLRHSQLRFVGAPELPRSIVDDIRTQTGWFWHRHINELLVGAGVPVLQEVNVTPWLPKGWSGTADWLFWHPEYEAFVLGDLKTAKGEAIKWKESSGMSEEHLWQLSAYWHALYEGGFPLLDKLSVLYLPMNNVMREDDPEPTFIEASPLSAEVVYAQMAERKAAVDAYAEEIPIHNYQGLLEYCVDSATGLDPEDYYLSDKLAPIMERVQKLVWAKDKWDVKLFPHWLSDFCPFPNELCDCSEQGSTKVGHWVLREGGVFAGVEYIPREGYEEYEPEVMPTSSEVRRRFK